MHIDPESSQSLDLLKDTIPSWTLRIQGRLLDVRLFFSHKQPPNTRKPPTNPPRFSNFVKKVVVELKRDESLYPQGNIIEVCYNKHSHPQWEKKPGEPESDGFEIKRRGDTDVPVKILLYLDRHPEKFKLSPSLGHLLDIHTDTMPNVLVAIWQYVKVSFLHRSPLAPSIARSRRRAMYQLR